MAAPGRSVNRSAGPGGAFCQENCAATVLGGNYSEPVDSRLIRHTSFVVPPESQNPRLRFWHWYSFSTSDYGQVHIKVDGESWQTLFSNYTSTGSGCWTRPFINLSAYTGQSVQIAFKFHSQIYGNTTDESSGWYIDQVMVETGPVEFCNPEDFESGLGNWSARRGTWQVGAGRWAWGRSLGDPVCRDSFERQLLRTGGQPAGQSALRGAGCRSVAAASFLALVQFLHL
ncbi:MAG: hypothetical protein ABIF77_00860 [bacterium]